MKKCKYRGSQEWQGSDQRQQEFVVAGFEQMPDPLANG